MYYAELGKTSLKWNVSFENIYTTYLGTCGVGQKILTNASLCRTPGWSGSEASYPPLEQYYSQEQQLKSFLSNKSKKLTPRNLEKKSIYSLP